MSEKKFKGYTHLSLKQEEEVASLYKKGYPVSEIVHEYNISFWKVYNCLDKRNIPRTFIRPNSIRYSDFSRLTEDDVKHILKDLQDNKLTNDEISLKYNLGTEHTLREIKEKNLPFLKDSKDVLSELDNVDYN